MDTATPCRSFPFLSILSLSQAQHTLAVLTPTQHVPNPVKPCARQGSSPAHTLTPRLISQRPLSDLTNLPTRRYKSTSKDVSSPTAPRNLGAIAAQRIERLGVETASQSRQSSRDKNEIEADLVCGSGCLRWHFEKRSEVQSTCSYPATSVQPYYRSPSLGAAYVRSSPVGVQSR